MLEPLNHAGSAGTRRLISANVLSVDS